MLKLGRVEKLLRRGITQVEALMVWASSLRARPRCKESLDLQVPFDLRLQLKLRAQSNEHQARQKENKKIAAQRALSWRAPRKLFFLGFGSLLAAFCPSAASPASSVP